MYSLYIEDLYLVHWFDKIAKPVTIFNISVIYCVFQISKIMVRFRLITTRYCSHVHLLMVPIEHLHRGLFLQLNFILSNCFLMVTKLKYEKQKKTAESYMGFLNLLLLFFYKHVLANHNFQWQYTTITIIKIKRERNYFIMLLKF